MAMALTAAVCVLVPAANDESPAAVVEVPNAKD